MSEKVKITVGYDDFKEGGRGMTNGTARINGRYFIWDVVRFAYPSHHGIDNGRLSLLRINEFNAKTREWLRNSIAYERGWLSKADASIDTDYDAFYMPEGKDDDTLAVYRKILEMYN